MTSQYPLIQEECPDIPFEITQISPKIVNVSRQKSKKQICDIAHLPAGTYHIEIYPSDSADRIFYGSQVVKL